MYKSRNQTCICSIYMILPHFSFKITKNYEFVVAEANELKTLEALSWNGPDSRGTFNVVPFKDLSFRVGL